VRPILWILASSILFHAMPHHRASTQSTEERRTAQIDSAFPASTMGGVYTTAQAARGEEAYFSLCVSCHPAGTMHSEPAFSATWAGRPLSDLYDAIKDKMPKNDPGTLTLAEAAQLVAYLLKMNSIPAGKTDLPADREALQKIRIETGSMLPIKQS
jgi:mono/diheme cytochrome c family protein